MKRITITVDDDKYVEFYREVGEIVGIAAYLEADIAIHDIERPKYASGGFVGGTRLTEPA